MNVMSGYPSKNHKIGEDEMDARPSSLNYIPLFFESVEKMGVELGPSCMDVDDVDSRSSSEMNGIPEYLSKKQKITKDGMDGRISSLKIISSFSLEHELGSPCRDVLESGSSGIDDVDLRSSSEMNGMPKCQSKKQKIRKDGMDDRISSLKNIPLFSIEVELGSPCMDVLESGSSGIDDADSRSSSEMNGMSGYPSNNQKIGEDGIAARLSTLNKIPLLSDICEMECIHRFFGEQVKFDQETLFGNYFLFFSFVLPPSNYPCVNNPLYPDDLFDLCADLYSARDDFEMVIFAKANKEDDLRSPASRLSYRLEHYFFGIPSYFLVVPFEESNRPNFMYESLDLVDPGAFKCLLVNANKNISVRGHPDSMLSLTEHLKKLKQESPFDCLRSSQRIIKRLWPVIPQEQKNPYPRNCPIANKLDAVELEYGHHINEMVSDSKKLFPTKIGQPFDVISLLSGKGEMKKHLVRNCGDRVEVDKETFSGKYIMICCFEAPVFRHEQSARYAQGLATTCSDLYSLRNDFEMVVVAKMNQLANYEVFFNHFLSGFPPPCLVVPFEDAERRDFICKYLDLRPCYGPSCLILDKGMDIKRNILDCGCAFFACNYGADAFPFTEEVLDEVRSNDHMWWDGDVPPPANYEELLGCNPSDILHKTLSSGDHEETTVLELSRKVVGVYVCLSGNFIPTLGKVYQQCRAEEKEFEILLVYVPFYADTLDPQIHMANIVSLLLEWGISWWEFPPSGPPNKLFNGSVSSRVSRCLYDCQDQIIIMGRDCSFLEPHGLQIMSNFGVDAYPFSSECAVEIELERVEKLTLESLLLSPGRDYVYKEKKKIHVSELRGKKILLYLARFGDYCLAEKVKAWYFEMKGIDPNVEVVIVRRFDYLNCSHVMGEDEGDVRLSELFTFMHVCPFDPQHSASLVNVLFMGGRDCAALIKFGTDGRVCSMEVVGRNSEIPGGFLFDKSQLRDDITCHLRSKRYI